MVSILAKAHYGVIVVSTRKARNAVRWAASLVARAADEVESEHPEAARSRLRSTLWLCVHIKLRSDRFGLTGSM